MYTKPFHSMGPMGVNLVFLSRPELRAESGDLKNITKF